MGGWSKQKRKNKKGILELVIFVIFYVFLIAF